MRRNVVVSVLVVLLAVGIVVVGPAQGEGSQSRSGAIVNTAYNKTLKTTILVNGAGMTLYLYTADHKGVSACAKDPSCTPIWYVLKPGGHVTAGAGVKASLLGTNNERKASHLQRASPLYLPRLPEGLRPPGQEARAGERPRLLQHLVRRLTERERDQELRPPLRTSRTSAVGSGVSLNARAGDSSQRCNAAS